MKTLITFLAGAVTLTLLAGGCGPRVVKADKLVERNGLVCEADSGEPFSGTVVENWPNGRKKLEINYHKGKLQGLYCRWHENGEKEMESEWRNGEILEGQCWDEEGNPKDCEQVYQAGG